MSIFLMGCYNSQTKKFVTVTKCGNGFDDKKLDSLQKELKTNMRRVNKVRVTSSHALLYTLHVIIEGLSF